MKRNGGIFTFLTIMFSSLVSAQGPVEGLERLTEGAREVIDITIRFIADILFDLESFDELFFAKILIALIIFMVTYTVLRRNDIFGKDKKIAVIITSAITILAVRYLPTNFVQAILLQYSIFAVAVTTLIPFILFFFFLHQSGMREAGRRIGWVLYAASFIAMWAFRYEDIGNANYIYWVGIIAVAISLIFDSSIHKYFKFSDFRKATAKINQEARYRLEERAEKAAERLEKRFMTPEQYKREIKDINDAIKQL